MIAPSGAGSTPPWATLVWRLGADEPPGQAHGQDARHHPLEGGERHVDRRGVAYPRFLTSRGMRGIVKHMPNYSAELDAVLRALADPTRRRVVERLAKSPAVVSDLLAPFSMTLPSLLQHLRILEDARVVASNKQGRVRTVSLRPGALDVLHVWLGEQRTSAERQADRLGIHLARTTTKET